MAIWYTDFLTGNDTTGNGTIATPYKTVGKAMTVGTNGDEIRVAGSGFTALPGTCTNAGGAFLSTSQSLVGLVNPGDIITYNDANYGDQKFFYKVFSVTATQINIDANPNFHTSETVTISKLTTQHYYATTTNVTFENIAVGANKAQFDVRGGWINSFTEQTGWTVMNYHSSATATATSGTGFTAPTSGNGLYVDRFMFSHLATGLAGHTGLWYPGTLAFTYMPSSTAMFGANPMDHINPVYVNKDMYLSNARFTGANQPQYATDGSPALSYQNIWSDKKAVTAGFLSAAPVKINNLYTKSTGGNNGMATNLSLMPSVQCVINNLYVSSTAPNAQYNNINGVESVHINNSINKIGLGPNLIYFSTVAGLGNLQIYLPTQNVENLANDSSTGWGAAQNNAPVGNAYASLKITGFVKDVEGFKSILGGGQILFADPTEYSTGTNSLRIGKTNNFTGQNSLTPIEAIFVDSASAKTITIRCKADVAGNVVFAFMQNMKAGIYSGTSSPTRWANESHAVGTTWTDITYTGLSAYNANLFLNSFLSLCIEAQSIPGKYIWIDSVTIA